MKSKLTMLIFAGALTLGATAQNAMAGTPARAGAFAVKHSTPARAGAFAVKRSTPARAGANAVTQSKKVSNRAAVPPHTILNGAKNNAF